MECSLLRTFYTSSDFYDKDFVYKTENLLEAAAFEGREIVIMGDFKCDLFVKKSIHRDGKLLKSLARSD